MSGRRSHWLSDIEDDDQCPNCGGSDCVQPCYREVYRGSQEKNAPLMSAWQYWLCLSGLLIFFLAFLSLFIWCCHALSSWIF
jgi:hypothetical protein